VGLTRGDDEGDDVGDDEGDDEGDESVDEEDVEDVDELVRFPLSGSRNSTVVVVKIIAELWPA
jgi:hypothetical protein